MKAWTKFASYMHVLYNVYVEERGERKRYGLDT